MFITSQRLRLLSSIGLPKSDQSPCPFRGFQNSLSKTNIAKIRVKARKLAYFIVIAAD